MRRVKWGAYQVKRAGFARARAKLGLEKKSSSRVRDKEERELLLRLDRARLDAWRQEGRLKVAGPRKLQFKI